MTLNFRLIKLVAFDAIFAAGLYFVLMDLAGRAAYAQTERLTLSKSYLPFISYSTILGRDPISLTSPPTLDWVQVLAVLMIATTVYYLATMRKGQPEQKPVPDSGPA